MNRIEVINHVILEKNYKTYLEIGVRDTSICFDNILCEYKDSVDPGIEIETNAKYKYTSDEFFFKLNNNELEIPYNFKYDCIFIDGLHLSYQVEKDIINSLNCLSDNGTIILHDTNPFLFEYNPMRVVEDYWGQQWNGTVWKAIYKMKCTRNDLKIFTLNSDEGLTIIQRGQQELVPFDNPYFEYKLFYNNVKRDLNLIEVSEIDKWI